MRTKCAPCPVCRRFHRGPRCKPDEERSVSIGVTVPNYVLLAMREQIPWGERSAYITRLIEEDLL